MSCGGCVIKVVSEGGGGGGPVDETVTTLVDNGDGTFTYTSEDGTVTVFDACACGGSGDETVTTLIDNGDGTFTYTSEDGTETIISSSGSSNPSIVTPIVTDQAIATHDDGAGNVTTIYETVTTFVDNGDGTYTYTSEDGTVTTTECCDDVLTTLVDNGDGTWTYTSEDGTVTVISAAGGLSIVTPIVTDQAIATHDDGQGTVTTIYETVTTFVDNGDGTYTYTSEDGTVTVTECCDDVVTTLVDNGDGTWTYTSEDGTVTIISAGGGGGMDSISTVTPIVTDNAIATHEDGNGVTTTIYETVTTFVDNGDGTYTYTSEDGTVTTTECCDDELTTLVDNGDGTYTYTSEDGTVTIINAGGAGSNSSATQVVTGNQIATHDDGQGNVTSIEETITTLVDNGDGTWTYTSEDGTVTIINSSNIITTLVDNGDGTWTYTSEDGTVTIIDQSCCEFVYVEVDPLVHTDGAPAAGDGTPGNPFQIPLPCCPQFEYVPFDPAIHDPGVAEGDGTAGNPWQIPLGGGDPCAILATGDPIACEDVTSVLVGDGETCGPVATDDLIPDHIYSQCVTPAEIINSFVGAPGQPISLSMTEQDRGQVGSLVVGGAAGNAVPYSAVSPYSVTLPPSTPGCIQFVEISYGANSFTGEVLHHPTGGSGGVGGTIWNIVPTNQTGSIGAETQIFSAPSNYVNGSTTTGSYQLTQTLYAYEVTGTTGGSVDFTWPNVVPPADGAFQGVLHHTVWEVCSSSGTLTAADFGGVTRSDAYYTVADLIPNGTIVESDPVDGGACDALYFGVGRHVFPSQPQDFALNADSDWSTPSDPGVIEVTDLATQNAENVCQMGVTAGLIPAGTGPITYGYEHNDTDANGLDQFNQGPWATWHTLPFTGCDELGEAGPVRTTKCEQELTNGCHGDAKLSAQISASAEFTLEPGASFCISPVINGVVVATEVVGYDNTNGAAAQVVTLPLSFNYCDMQNLVAANDSTSIEVCFEITDKNGVNGASQISITDVVVDAELTHV